MPGTKPYADIENARIMTESFIKTEGEPYVVRKAKAFRVQCERKTFHIWEDELIGYKTKIVRNCAFHQHIPKKINAGYMGPIV